MLAPWHRRQRVQLPVGQIEIDEVITRERLIARTMGALHSLLPHPGPQSLIAVDTASLKPTGFTYEIALVKPLACDRLACAKKMIGDCSVPREPGEVPARPSDRLQKWNFSVSRPFGIRREGPEG